MQRASLQPSLWTTSCWHLALLLMVHGIASQSSCEDEELALFQRDLSLSERSKAVMLQPPEKEKSFLLSNVSGVHSVAAGFARPDIAGLLSISSSSRRAARRVGLMMRTRISFIAQCVILGEMLLLGFMTCLLCRAREARQGVEGLRLPRNDSLWQKAIDDKAALQQSLFPATHTNSQLVLPASSRERPIPESDRIHTPSPSTIKQVSLSCHSTKVPQLPLSSVKQARFDPDAKAKPQPPSKKGDRVDTEAEAMSRDASLSTLQAMSWDASLSRLQAAKAQAGSTSTESESQVFLHSQTPQFGPSSESALDRQQ